MGQLRSALWLPLFDDLADPKVVISTAVEITEVREPIYYGPDAAGARDALFDPRMVQGLVTDLDAAETARALDRLLTMLDAHDTGEGGSTPAPGWSPRNDVDRGSSQSAARR